MKLQVLFLQPCPNCTKDTIHNVSLMNAAQGDNGTLSLGCKCGYIKTVTWSSNVTKMPEPKAQMSLFKG